MIELQTTTVYRVENPGDRRGPYCHSGFTGVDEDLWYEAMSLIDSSDESHPCTSSDPLLEPFFIDIRDGEIAFAGIVGYHYRHGFRDIDTMLAWFHSGSLGGLIAAGFNVVEYTLPVNRVLHGTYQSIFDHASALAERIVSRRTES